MLALKCCELREISGDKLEVIPCRHRGGLQAVRVCAGGDGGDRRRGGGGGRARSQGGFLFYFIVRLITIPLNCFKLMNEGGGPAAGQVGRRLRPPLPRHLPQLRRGGGHLFGRHQGDALPRTERGSVDVGGRNSDETETFQSQEATLEWLLVQKDPTNEAIRDESGDELRRTIERTESVAVFVCTCERAESSNW